MRTTLFVTLASAFALASCFAPSGRAPDASVKKAAEEAMKEKSVLVMGDSLTAGYQLPPESSYPAQLEKLLKAEGYRYRVTNAGVSGDTSAGLLERADWLLSDPLPSLVVLCIGSNDGLQGLSPEQMDKNVRAIVDKIQSRGVPVALIGVKIPRNLGADYVAKFEAVHPKIAKDEKLPFLPFLLEGVAKDPKLTLGDGLHPNADGYAIVAKNVLEFLKKERLVTK
ncbi:MAG: arylesterase [Patescibacteria group bacterium]